ncbi:MAG: hypothetical protein KGN76_11835 [Acidobacteriota bacterium]|nr:hypothetical protein [Acidobacteriota bacterium]
MMAHDDPRRQAARTLPAGLCEACRHVRRIRSDRETVFYRCERSRVDPRFPRYPPIPVIACPGFEPESGPADEPA